MHCERGSLNSIYAICLVLSTSETLSGIRRRLHLHSFAMYSFSAPFQLFLTYLSTVDEQKWEEEKKKLWCVTQQQRAIYINICKMKFMKRRKKIKRTKKKVSARTQLNLWYLSLCGCVDYNINAVIIVYFQKLFLCFRKINSFIAFLFMITADVYCDRGSEMKLKTCKGKMKK